MWSLLVCAVLSVSTAEAVRADGAGQACLPMEEIREIVAAKRVVAPVAAIEAARQAVPQAEVVRATLCRRGPALVYWIVALRRDGRFAYVTVDASSGKLAGVQ